MSERRTIYPLERFAALLVHPADAEDLATAGYLWHLQRAIFDARMRCVAAVAREGKVSVPGRERVTLEVRVVRDAVDAAAAPHLHAISEAARHFEVITHDDLIAEWRA